MAGVSHNLTQEVIIYTIYLALFLCVGTLYRYEICFDDSVTLTVLLRGNVVLAHKYFSSKQHPSIEFCVQICSQEYSKRVLEINSSARFCMYARIVRDSLSDRRK